MADSDQTTTIGSGPERGASLDRGAKHKAGDEIAGQAAFRRDAKPVLSIFEPGKTIAVGTDPQGAPSPFARNTNDAVD